MADDPTQIAELEPVDPGVVGADEALDLSDQLSETDADATLILNPGPTPLGQTIAWDFVAHQRANPEARGPHMVRGNAALEQWIEKCLRTAAGAHPIHPDGYGMEIPITDLIGYGPQQVDLSELEEAITKALTFHPAIKAVIGFEANWELEDEVTGDASLALNFTVVKDDDTAVRVNQTFAATEPEGALA